LRRVGDAYGDYGLEGTQPADGHIVVARAVADAVAAAVERRQRNNENVGIDLGRIVLRFADTPDAFVERLTERIRPHDQRLAAASHHRQREFRAGCREFAHQRQRIDLGLERGEARHNRAGCNRQRERPRRDRLGRGLPLGGRQRIAPRERGLAQIGFELVYRNGRRHQPRRIPIPRRQKASAEPRRPSERDPGNLHK
jgi:hypothetical protein